MKSEGRIRNLAAFVQTSHPRVKFENSLQKTIEEETIRLITSCVCNVRIDKSDSALRIVNDFLGEEKEVKYE